MDKLMLNRKLCPLIGNSHPDNHGIDGYQKWPRNLLQLFEQTVNRFARKEAIVEEARTLTYRQLLQKSRSLAGYMQKTFNLQKGERVGLVMDQTLEFYVSVIGTLYCGGIVIPIDTGLNQDELHSIIKELSLSVIIVNDRLISRCDHHLKEVKVMKESEVLSLRQKFIHELRIPFVIQQEDPAFMLYTAGEYHQLKEVIFTHGNGIQTYVQTERVSNNDSVAMVPRVVQSSTLEEWMAFLYVGCTIFVSLK
jgi:acyl-CoA synthetase (AMP-forming)/AMP-acid ligase II